MPLKLVRAIQVSSAVYHWNAYAKLANEFPFEERGRHSLVVREPVGVVAAITPWNYPLNQITLKVAAALAAGCTVVLKPSEVAPLNAFVLAEAIHEAGLPAGVFNLVSGYGPVVGEVLASHPSVDMVSFTGSTRAGKRVSELASASVKRVALELGGKSASVILDDADFAAAVKGTVSACFLNAGQTCSAHTRMLVPEARYDEARALAKAAAETYVAGDPRNDATRLGALASAAQQARVAAIHRAWHRGGRRTGDRRPGHAGRCVEGLFREADRVRAVCIRRRRLRRKKSLGRCCRSSRTTTKKKRFASPTIRCMD